MGHLIIYLFNLIVINNIFIKNGTELTAVFALHINKHTGTFPAGTIKIKNNNVYNCISSKRYCINLDPTDLTGIDGNISADPKFVTASDLHLQKTSPAIDTGATPAIYSEVPATDYGGTMRPQGNGYDMGAYEYVFTSTGLFSDSSVMLGVPVTSTLNGGLIVEKIQTTITDDYFDSVAKIKSAVTTYTHSDGRQRKFIVHSGLDLQGIVSWGALSRDGTWALTEVVTYDAEGASRSVPGTIFDSSNRVVIADGVVTLP
jgi:hypothetical protein